MDDDENNTRYLAVARILREEKEQKQKLVATFTAQELTDELKRRGGGVLEPDTQRFKCPDCDRTFESDIHLGIHHYADHQIAHDAVVRNVAINDVINTALVWLYKHDNDKYDMPSVRKYIKSLRTSGENQR